MNMKKIEERIKELQGQMQMHAARRNQLIQLLETENRNIIAKEGAIEVLNEFLEKKPEKPAKAEKDEKEKK